MLEQMQEYRKYADFFHSQKGKKKGQNVSQKASICKVSVMSDTFLSFINSDTSSISLGSVSLYFPDKKAEAARILLLLFVL